MFTSPSVRLACASLLSLGLLAACQQPSTSDVDQTEEGVVRLGSVEAVDTVSRTVAPNDRPLIIDGFQGRIRLNGGDRQAAEFQFVRRGRGADTESAQGVLEDVTITESGSEESYTYTLETDGGAYAAVDVTGTLPRATEVRVEQATGPVTIVEIEGPLTVTHEHGPVTVRQAAASVDVEIQNGDIDVDLRTLPPDASVTLETSNGDITLHLPPTVSAELSAQTSVGTIQTNGLTLSDERFIPRNAGGRYTAQMGPGDASINLESQNGSILVQRRDTATLDDAIESLDRDPRAVPSSDTTVVSPPEEDTVAVDPDTIPDTTAVPETSAPDTTMD